MNNCFEIIREKLPSSGNFPACYAFSIHKAGSTLMYKMIKEACAKAGIPAISIPDIFFREGVLDSDWRGNNSLNNCFSDGRIYFGFRYFPEVLLNKGINLHDKKSVLLIRDPRDALVSEFFSYGGTNISHVIPAKNSKAFIEQFSRLKGVDIDSYVIQAATGHMHKILAYTINLNHSLVKVFRYEDVFFNKHQFLRDIFEYFSLPISTEIIKEVATINDIRPVQENYQEHIRKGTPGDHIVKLKPETIKSLNEIFRDVYMPYGYDFC